MRVVYFGMLGAFSVPPLQALLHADFNVCAVVVPALLPSGPPIAPLLPPRRTANLGLIAGNDEPNIAQMAWERSIPVFELRHARSPETIATLAALHSNVGCVACFAQRLPETLLSMPTHGFFNVHPSLLPHGRGPEPLFWTFRNGEPAGVTIHVMSEALDAGDIVAQTPVALPEGTSGAAAERHCATAGATLLVEALHNLETGTLIRHPQPQGGSYHPAPTAADFVISTAWSAQRIFHFMRGTAEWGEPYTIEIADRRFTLHAALTYDAEALLGSPYEQEGNEIAIQCTPGVLRAKLASYVMLR